MHQPGGGLVGLGDVLSLIKSPDLTWRMTFLDVVGRREGTLNLLDLERRIKESERGVLFSGAELQAMADQLSQVIDSDLSGFPEGHPDGTDVESVAVVEAFDSSEWNLIFNESEVGLDYELLAVLGAELLSD